MSTIKRILIAVAVISIFGIAFMYGKANQTPVNAPPIPVNPPPGCVGGKISIPANSDSSYFLAAVQDLMSSRSQDECNFSNGYSFLVNAYAAQQLQIQQIQAQLKITPPPPPPTCNPPNTLVNGVCTPPAPPPSGTLAIGAKVSVVSPCPAPCHMWPSVAAGGGVTGPAIPLTAGATGTVIAGPITTGNGGIWWQVNLAGLGTGWLDPGFITVTQ